jgi:predicted DNA-binding transcriptional regulator YafY
MGWRYHRDKQENGDVNPELPPSEWLDNIRVVSRSLAMQQPMYYDRVVAMVYEAVLRGKRLGMRYRLRGGGAIKEYPEVNPLGLVFVDNLIYLVASL